MLKLRIYQMSRLQQELLAGRQSDGARPNAHWPKAVSMSNLRSALFPEFQRYDAHANALGRTTLPVGHRIIALEMGKMHK